VDQQASEKRVSRSRTDMSLPMNSIENRTFDELAIALLLARHRRAAEP
jgi:hypothetical protein